jgi:hypothetical protein
MVCTGLRALIKEVWGGRRKALLRTTVKIWVGKEVKRQLGRPRCRWFDVII